jgi:hypothetical protein
LIAFRVFRVFRGPFSDRGLEMFRVVRVVRGEMDFNWR